MTSTYTNVLSNEELDYLNNHPEVLSAKASLDSKKSGNVYFSVPITNLIHSTLKSQFGLHLSVDSRIPMRWIKGDTPQHIDMGASKFENTYLIYLNDSPGKLIVDSESYPIESNTGFVFNEGLLHETQCTENYPRLLLGPMNEFSEPVGAPSKIYYYNSLNDALNVINFIAFSITYVINGAGSTYGVSGEGLIDLSISSWKIAPNSTGTSPINLIYNNGDTLAGDQAADPVLIYYLYPAVVCFLEGSTILCQVDGNEKYVPVEQLKKGTLVKTSLNGYKSVVIVAKGTINNPGNDERTGDRLYKCSTAKYPQLKEDLYITGYHSILEFPITEKQKEDTIKHSGRLFITDKKYRLMAFLDERAEPWNSKGEYTIWNFALENTDPNMNYGVYANGGLLVETSFINHLKKKSNMECFE